MRQAGGRQRTLLLFIVVVGIMCHMPRHNKLSWSISRCAQGGKHRASWKQRSAWKQRITPAALIFDCDGTLVDTETAYMDSFNWALSNISNGKLEGSKVSAQVWGQDFVGQGNGSKVAAARFGLNCTAAEFNTLWMNRFREIIACPGHIPLLKGFDEVYSEARAKGLKVAVASSSEGYVLQQKLVNGVLANSKVVNTLSEFDLILSNDNVTRCKPDPEIYLLAAAQLNIVPENCVVIEDSTTGVLAGSRAGMQVVAVPNQYTMSHDFTQATEVAESMSDVIKYLF